MACKAVFKTLSWYRSVATIFIDLNFSESLAAEFPACSNSWVLGPVLDHQLLDILISSLLLPAIDQLVLINHDYIAIIDHGSQ